MSHETLILGIGNTLLTDEGTGIHAMHLLQSAAPELWPETWPDKPSLTFLDGGTLSFTLATWIENCTNLIVFDAAQLHQPAGTVNTFKGDAMDEFLGASKRSAHEVGLLDLIDIARLTGHLPEKRALIGIQPKKLGWGMTPTPVVEKALPQAVDEAVTLINLWQKVNTGQDISAPDHYASDSDQTPSATGVKISS